MPRSKSRAVRSLVSVGSSRCPIPGGRTQARSVGRTARPRSVAEIGAGRPVDRRQHLQQHENRPRERQRSRSSARRAAPPPRATPMAIANPPGATPVRAGWSTRRTRAAVRLGQDCKELPVTAAAQPFGDAGAHRRDRQAPAASASSAAIVASFWSEVHGGPNVECCTFRSSSTSISFSRIPLRQPALPRPPGRSPAEHLALGCMDQRIRCQNPRQFRQWSPRCREHSASHDFVPLDSQPFDRRPDLPQRECPRRLHCRAHKRLRLPGRQLRRRMIRLFRPRRRRIRQSRSAAARRRADRQPSPPPRPSPPIRNARGIPTPSASGP